MQKNTFIAVITIAALVFMTACTGRQANVDVNNGVTINNFIVTPAEARDGEFVLFDVEFENTGGTTASNVQIELFGVEGQWRDSFGNLLTSTQARTYGRMERPRPENNVPGDLKIAQFNFMTPNIPQGIAPSLPVEARVSFDYNTSGHMKLFVLNEDEFRRRQALQQATEQAEIINSAGPIKLSVPERFITNPMVLGSNDEEETLPLMIQFMNVGNGFPITPEYNGQIIGMGGKLTGQIELFGPPGVEFADCLGVSGGRSIDINDAQIPLRIRDSGTVPIACSLKINKAQWGTRPIDSIQLVFNIFYRYYVYSRADVTVIGE
ncbi:MAG TPA: hypothetical protein VI968_03265 [archaeon]|nr:hypothetical protein [archaeon]